MSLQRFIEPVPAFGRLIRAVGISDVVVTPFQQAVIRYTLHEVHPVPDTSGAYAGTSIGEAVHTGSFTMSGEEYADWNNDDSYLFDRLAKHLNASLVAE